MAPRRSWPRCCFGISFPVHSSPAYTSFPTEALFSFWLSIACVMWFLSFMIDASFWKYVAISILRCCLLKCVLIWDSRRSVQTCSHRVGCSWSVASVGSTSTDHILYGAVFCFVCEILVCHGLPLLHLLLSLLTPPSLLTSTDYAKGFGGKFGVETDKVDKSAVGFEYQGKTERHESQKGWCH